MYSKFSPLWRGGKTATTAIHFYCAGSVAANYRLAPFKPMSHQFGYYSTIVHALFQFYSNWQKGTLKPNLTVNLVCGGLPITCNSLNVTSAVHSALVLF